MTCDPGLITLPYHSDFSTLFDPAFVACDGSTWDNVSGYLQCTDLGGNTVASLLADTGSEDMDLTVAWGSAIGGGGGSLGDAGVYFNYLDANNHHVLRGNSGAATVYRVSGGTATAIANLVPSPAAGGRTTRIVLKNGMLFCFDPTHLELAFLGASAAIPGGTLVGYLSAYTPNLFDEITFQSPLYYHDHGSLATSDDTGFVDAGSQRQCSIFYVTTDAGSPASPEQWENIFNSYDSIDGWGIRWQKADSPQLSQGDYPVADWSGGSDIRVFGITNPSAGTWFAQITYQNIWKWFTSSDGLTWSKNFSFPFFSTSHGQAYDDANHEYRYTTTNRSTFDNCKTWAFSEIIPPLIVIVAPFLVITAELGLAGLDAIIGVDIANTNLSGPYDYTIDYGDGITDSFSTSDLTHTFNHTYANTTPVTIKVQVNSGTTFSNIVFLYPTWVSFKNKTTDFYPRHTSQRTS